MSLRLRSASLVFAGIFCISLVVMAPASLLSAQLEGYSGGRLLLAGTRGTLWNGSGVLLFAADTQYVSLGEYAWRLQPAELLSGGMEFEVKRGVDASPMRVRYEPLRQAAQLSQWHTTLPAQVLAVLAPQLRPYQLNGEIELRAESVSFSQNGIAGEAKVDWLQAGSGLTDVYPLGDYRILLEGGGRGLSVQLSTISGKLHLTGSGQMQPGHGLSFKGTAQAANGEQQEGLSELLHHVGPEISPGVFSLGLVAQ